MTENLWNYSVYYAESVADLKAAIESGHQLERDKVSVLRAGFIAAVAYPEAEAQAAREALIREIDGPLDSMEHSY